MINALILTAALLVAQEAPTPIAAVNEPTESAKAVYLADAAAKKRGHRNELAVLGTAHLRILPDDFDVQRFDPLIDRLVDWAPERIAIESISGPQCDYLRAYDAIYEGTADRYCPDPEPARKAFAVTGPEAVVEIRRILSEQKPDRPEAERRRLAGLFLATGDPWSALVQWLRLDTSERTADDGLTHELVEYLNARAKRKGEDTIIAAALAVKLGHERLYLVDDHSCCRWHSPTDDETYGRELQEIWNNDWAKISHNKVENWTKTLINNPESSVLDWYLKYNSVEQARLVVAQDFGAAAGADVPGKTGRKYLAYWEYRNMRMAANIRDVIGDGAKVLAVVGANHKPYYERYLGVMSDLEIVDIQTIID